MAVLECSSGEFQKNHSVKRDSKVQEWVTKIGLLTSAYMAQQKQACCYCGDHAHEGDPETGCCCLDCVCTWESAHTCWNNAIQNRDTTPDADYMFIERAFAEASDVRNPISTLALRRSFDSGWHACTGITILPTQ